MSYDLYCFEPVDGEDPLATAERKFLADEEADEGECVALDQALVARQERIAQVLEREHPELTRFVFDYEAIAKSRGISVEAARSECRHIELNTPEEGSGIQITVWEDSVSVSVALWHRGEAARQVLKELWSYLETITREGGMAVFDPQMNRVLDLSRDGEDVLREYGGGAEATAGLTRSAAERKRPWWRFW